MLAKLARFVNERPKRIVAASALLLVLLAGLGAGAPRVLVGGGFDVPGSESFEAADQLDREFGGVSNIAFVLESKRGNVDEPSSVLAGKAFTERLTSEPGVTKVASYWTTASPSMKSESAQAALVVARIDGSDDEIEDRTKDLVKDFGENETFDVAYGGLAGTGHDLTELIGSDLARAEAIAIPLTLILLLFAFRSVIAASLPLLIGVFAIFGTLGVLFILGSITDVSIYALNLTTAMGLGLAIDYSLLIVNRFREELRNGLSVNAAVTTTVQTAGRTVVFSAATVAVALVSLSFFPMFFLRSFAYAGISVVLLAMLAALVLLPAVLRLLGTRVNALRVGRAADNTIDSPFWGRLARGVMRRPVVSAIPVVAVLLLMAVPLANITFGLPDDRVVSADVPSRAAGDAIREDFPANDSNTIPILLQGETASYAGYFTQLSQVEGVQRVETAEGTFSAGGRVGDSAGEFVRPGVQYANVVSSLDQSSPQALAAVEDMRKITTPPGTTAGVGGSAAELIDLKSSIGSRIGWAVGFIALTTLVLLFLYTGSVLIPLKAILLNLLTMGAVIGSIVWVFQEGNLSGVIDFNPSPVNIPMPMLLFCIAFGLSMDYEVFVLSRIKEARELGMSNHDAVVHGLGHTARIITTAAALLSVTFIAFGISDVSFLQLFGLGTALAIVLDATLVRGVLVPAFMSLLGEANWWAPRPLRRFHARFGLSDGIPSTTETVRG